MLHTPAGYEMRKIPSLFLQEERPSLYVWLPLIRLLQQGPSLNSSTQWGGVVPYYPKAYYQHYPKHCICHRGRPNHFPVHPPGCISPLRSGVLTPPFIADGERRPALPDVTSLASHALAETAAPNTATPAAIGSGKKIKSHTTNRRSKHDTHNTRQLWK